MKRVLTIALFVLIFLIGFAVLIYPAVSDYYNSLRHIRAVDEYFKAVGALSEKDYTEILIAANAYNERLLHNPNRFTMTDEEMVEYRSLLNPSGKDIIGTLEIEVIDINLPIYHGTNESVLQIGLGHLEGSSLPVGGIGTHAVITGHRGLPSSSLLTNLDRMILGDTFKIKVLNENLFYRVDQIKIVKPHETSALAIDKSKDYCTIITCTPYGINTHRLLVRGYRIEGYASETYVRPTRIPKEARVLNAPYSALFIIVPVTFTVLIILFIRLRRVYGRGKKQ